MKNVLLLIHDDEGQEARYQAALDVTRALDGHLTCLDVTIIPEFVGDYYPVGGAGLLLAEEQVTEDRNASRMRARLEREDVPFDWIDRTGFIEQTIESQARLADLIVLSSDANGTLFPHMTEVVGELLVRTGLPVLVVPPAAKSLNLFGRALVAWDGSTDAEAALRAALPLLQRAATVTLYYVDDRSIDLPLEQAAIYLARHGVEPVIKREPAGLDRAGTAILCESDMGHHDLVVMGGFGHSRTIEAIFGGASRTMLKKGKVPVLLVHHR